MEPGGEKPLGARMPSRERRDQIVRIARSLFAERGYDGTSLDEIAMRSGVSRTLVYEHFGGKEGVYAVVVDREMNALLGGVTRALNENRSRVRVEQVALAMLTYVEQRGEGFRILLRDSPLDAASGTYSSLIDEAAARVAEILCGDFDHRGLDSSFAPLYARALVGMVSFSAQSWLHGGVQPKEVVAAHLVNLCWNGLTGLLPEPRMLSAARS